MRVAGPVVTPPPRSWPTGMRLHDGEAWPVPADTMLDPDDPDQLAYRTTAHVRGFPVVAATLRRVGWIDQLGRVWLKVPPCDGFDGGSLTPLLIDARED